MVVVGDLERMLQAVDSIRSLGGNPVEVARAMVGLFTEPENIRRLKGAVDRKIQLKESSTKEFRRVRTGPMKSVSPF